MKKGCFRAAPTAAIVFRGTTDERCVDDPHVFFQVVKGKNLAAQTDELCERVAERLVSRTLGGIEERVLTWMMCWNRLRVEKWPFSLIGRELALLICDAMLEGSPIPPPFRVVVQHPTDLCFAEKVARDVVDSGELADWLAPREYEIEFEDGSGPCTTAQGLRPGYVQKRVKVRKGSKFTRLITVKADKDVKLRRALQDDQ